MKKIIVPILATVMIFTGCSSTQSSMEESAVVEVVNMESGKIMAQYNRLIEKKSKPEQILVFIDNNMDYLSEENADEVMIDLFEYLSKYGDIYMKKLFKGETQGTLQNVFPEKFKKSEIHHISNKGTRDLLTEIVNGKYKVVRFEGSYYPVVDYDYFKKYGPYVSNEINDYLKLMGRESSKVMSRDATLNISWNELGERLVQTEKYLEKYPNSPLKKQATSLYLAYLQVYIWGLDNAHIDNGQSIMLDDPYDSYEKMAKKYKNTNIGKILGEYVNILNKNNRIINEEIEKSREGLYRNAMSVLDEEIKSGQ